MSQRTMLILAAALSAFILVIAGGVAGRLSGAIQPGVATAEPAAADASAAATSFAEREAAYQATIAEANRRLELANQQLAQQAAAPAPATPAAAYAVSAEQAEQLALAAVPGAALARPAELVRYLGAPAYEVVLDRGTLYVDAQGAGILANAAAAPTSEEQAAEVAVAYRGGGEVREVERERERGVEVFEVEFSDGAVVYVEAGSGQVVYAQLGGDRYGAGEHNEGEHGDDEHGAGEHDDD